MTLNPRDMMSPPLNTHIHLQPRLPPPALHDPNAYRRDRLYRVPVSEALEQRLPVLEAVFLLFCAKGGARDMLRLEGWLAMLDAYGLLGERLETGEVILGELSLP